MELSVATDFAIEGNDSRKLKQEFSRTGRAMLCSTGQSVKENATEDSLKRIVEIYQDRSSKELCTAKLCG